MERGCRDLRQRRLLPTKRLAPDADGPSDLLAQAIRLAILNLFIQNIHTPVALIPTLRTSSFPAMPPLISQFKIPMHIARRGRPCGTCGLVRTIARRDSLQCSRDGAAAVYRDPIQRPRVVTIVTLPRTPFLNPRPRGVGSSRPHEQGSSEDRLGAFKTDVRQRRGRSRGRNGQCCASVPSNYRKADTRH